MLLHVIQTYICFHVFFMRSQLYACILVVHVLISCTLLWCIQLHEFMTLCFCVNGICFQICPLTYIDVNILWTLLWCIQLHEFMTLCFCVNGICFQICLIDIYWCKYFMNIIVMYSITWIHDIMLLAIWNIPSNMHYWHISM